jgi:hypothetical protein
MKTMAWTTLAATMLLGACASSPVPADRLARSEAAIRGADVVGADKVPAAAVHLRVAKEELAAARNMIKDGDNMRAEYMLLRSEADATVALTYTREAAVRADAEKTLAEVQRLKNMRPEGT